MGEPRISKDQTTLKMLRDADRPERIKNPVLRKQREYLLEQRARAIDTKNSLGANLSGDIKDEEAEIDEFLKSNERRLELNEHDADIDQRKRF